MKEPDGDPEESSRSDPAPADPRLSSIINPERDHKENTESRQNHAYESEDEAEKALRLFLDYVKLTFREAKPGERLVAWLTMVLVACNLAIGIIYWLQLKQMRRATYAAQKSADVAQDALLRGNRPWVGQTSPPLFLDKPMVGPDSVVANGMLFEIKNYGPSPALHVDMHIVPDIDLPPGGPEMLFRRSDNDLRAACALADMRTKDTESVTIVDGRQAQIEVPAGGQTIFPGGVAEIQEPINLKLGTGTTKNQSLRILGCVAYRDQFDKVVHHTKFCYLTSGAVGGVNAGTRPEPCGINQTAD